VVLVETPILGLDHGMLQIGRNAIEWNRILPLAIRFMMPPGFQTALRLDDRSGRVDPSQSEEFAETDDVEAEYQQEYCADRSTKDTPGAKTSHVTMVA
jgi:hypothetical protein